MRTGVAYKIEERREQQMWKNRNKCKKEAYKEQKENRGKEKREKKKKGTQHRKCHWSLPKRSIE